MKTQLKYNQSFPLKLYANLSKRAMYESFHILGIFYIWDSMCTRFNIIIVYPFLVDH